MDAPKFSCRDCPVYEKYESDKQDLRMYEVSIRAISSQIAEKGSLEHLAEQKRLLKNKLHDLLDVAHSIQSQIISTDECSGPTFIPSKRRQENIVEGVLICSTNPDARSEIMIYTPPERDDVDND